MAVRQSTHVSSLHEQGSVVKNIGKQCRNAEGGLDPERGGKINSSGIIARNLAGIVYVRLFSFSYVYLIIGV